MLQLQGGDLPGELISTHTNTRLTVREKHLVESGLPRSAVINLRYRDTPGDSHYIFAMKLRGVLIHSREFETLVCT